MGVFCVCVCVCSIDEAYVSLHVEAIKAAVDRAKLIQRVCFTETGWASRNPVNAFATSFG